MKIFLLIIIIFFVLVIFNLINKKRLKSKKKQFNEKTIDLEKDPKTNEYKPKK